MLPNLPPEQKPALGSRGGCRGHEKDAQEEPLDQEGYHSSVSAALVALRLINLAFNIELKLAEEPPQLPVRGIFIE